MNDEKSLNKLLTVANPEPTQTYTTLESVDDVRQKLGQLVQVLLLSFAKTFK